MHTEIRPVEKTKNRAQHVAEDLDANNGKGAGPGSAGGPSI